MTTNTIDRPKVVSREEWLVARKQHLAREKEFTRLRDQLSAERRQLPCVKVDKPYVFEGPNGKESLADLFGGNSQLIVYHFMYGPGAKDGCTGCSFLVDHLSGPLMHLPHHDVSMVAISRAPLAEFQAFRKRMGWDFKWLSSYGTDFNFDYHVSFTKESMAKGGAYDNYQPRESEKEGESPGISVFFKDDAGDIFHTYSSYARGLDLLVGTHNYLDLTPKGRNESSGMDWVRKHDKYV